MTRLQSFLVVVVLLVAGAAHAAFTGSCGVWAQKRNDFYMKNYPGNQAGFDDAKVYVGNAGFIQIGPGCEGNIVVPTMPDSVMVLRTSGGLSALNSGTLNAPRIGPYSTPTTGGAVRIIDGVFFARSGAGITKAMTELSTVGGGMLLMTKGRYDVPTNINVTGSNITFAGVGDSTNLFSTAAAGDDVFRVTGNAQNVVFRDFMIDGDRNNNNAGRAIDVESATARGITIDNVTVQRTNDAGIVSQAPVTVVQNCRLRDIGDGAGDGNGVWFQATADSSRAINNDIRDCKDVGIKVDTNADYATVVGNRVYNSTNGAIRFHENGGKYGHVQGNMFNGATSTMLAWFGGDSLTIADNVFTGSKIYSGLYLLRGKSVVITGNTCTFNVHHGIFLGYDNGDVQDATVTGNLCTGNQGSGIFVNPGSGGQARTFSRINISGNTCTGNGAYGITTTAATNASDITIGPNMAQGNTSGQVSLSLTNWTYNTPRSEGLTVGSAAAFTREGTSGSIIMQTNGSVLEMTNAGNCIVRASNAAGAFVVNTGGTNTRLTVASDGTGTFAGAWNNTGLLTANGGVTLGSATNLIVPNNGELQVKDTGGTARWVMRTAGTDILRFRPPVAGQFIYFSDNAVAQTILGIHDTGYIVIAKFIAFASLPAAQDGAQAYCSDCKGPADAGYTHGATAAGSGTGNMVFRIGGVWKAY